MHFHMSMEKYPEDILAAVLGVFIAWMIWWWIRSLNMSMIFSPCLFFWYLLDSNIFIESNSLQLQINLTLQVSHIDFRREATSTTTLSVFMSVSSRIFCSPFFSHSQGEFVGWSYSSGSFPHPTTQQWIMINLFQYIKKKLISIWNKIHIITSDAVPCFNCDRPSEGGYEGRAREKVS